MNSLTQAGRFLGVYLVNFVKLDSIEKLIKGKS